MKYFAVFLAAVGAIASTALAYFIWSQTPPSPSYEVIRTERIDNCKLLLSNFGEVERIFSRREGFVERTVLNLKEDRKLYPDDYYDAKELTEEAYEEQAKQQLLYDFFNPASKLQQFLDVGVFFFDQQENNQIGVDQIKAAVSGINRYAYYTSSERIPFEDRLALFEKVVANSENVKRLCAPILRGEDR